MIPRFPNSYFLRGRLLLPHTHQSETEIMVLLLIFAKAKAATRYRFSKIFNY
jgi:hypothetical protein